MAKNQLNQSPQQRSSAKEEKSADSRGPSRSNKVKHRAQKERAQNKQGKARRRQTHKDQKVSASVDKSVQELQGAQDAVMEATQELQSATAEARAAAVPINVLTSALKQALSSPKTTNSLTLAPKVADEISSLVQQVALDLQKAQRENPDPQDNGGDPDQPSVATEVPENEEESFVNSITPEMVEGLKLQGAIVNWNVGLSHHFFGGLLTAGCSYISKKILETIPAMPGSPTAIFKTLFGVSRKLLVLAACVNFFYAWFRTYKAKRALGFTVLNALLNAPIPARTRLPLCEFQTWIDDGDLKDRRVDALSLGPLKRKPYYASFKFHRFEEIDPDSLYAPTIEEETYSEVVSLSTVAQISHAANLGFDTPEEVALARIGQSARTLHSVNVDENSVFKLQFPTQTACLVAYGLHNRVQDRAALANFRLSQARAQASIQRDVQFSAGIALMKYLWQRLANSRRAQFLFLAVVLRLNYGPRYLSHLIHTSRAWLSRILIPDARRP